MGLEDLRQETVEISARICIETRMLIPTLCRAGSVMVYNAVDARMISSYWSEKTETLRWIFTVIAGFSDDEKLTVIHLLTSPFRRFFSPLF